MTPAYVVVINAATSYQREQIHEIIKASAEAWWHGFADSWIVVGGGAAAEWRDRIGELFVEGPGGVMVLKIDATTAEWAFRAPMTDATKEWLYTYLPGD